MKTNYREIRAALSDLQSARGALNRLSRLNIGVISGGPSMAAESDEFGRQAKRLIGLVRDAIGCACRLSRLAEVCHGETVVEPIIRDAISEAEFEREYRRGN